MEAETETAMCLWEEIVTNRPILSMMTLFGVHGAASLREFVADSLEPPVTHAYDIMSDQGWYDSPFDWEYCPLALTLLEDFYRDEGRLPTGPELASAFLGREIHKRSVALTGITPEEGGWDLGDWTARFLGEDYDIDQSIRDWAEKYDLEILS